MLDTSSVDRTEVVTATTKPAPSMQLIEARLRDELTECAVCAGVYRDPRILLPCLHTFCLPCLERLPQKPRKLDGQQQQPFSSSTEISCPLCRSSIEVPADGLRALPVNRFVDRFVELFALLGSDDDVEAADDPDSGRRHAGRRRRDSGNTDPCTTASMTMTSVSSLPVCDACARSSSSGGGAMTSSSLPVPSVYCVDCDDRLCSNCRDAHGKLRVSRTHRLVDVSAETPAAVSAAHASATAGEHVVGDDAISGSGTPAAANCRQHAGQPCAIYCEEPGCSRPICLVCAVVDHRAHKCIELAEVAAGLRTRLAAPVHSASVRVSLVRRRIDQLNLCLELTESAARRARDDIDRRCDDVIRVAERARNQLIAGVDDQRSRGSESIRKRRTDAESDAAALESAMASVDRLRVDGSDATIVDAAKRFEDTLTEALAEMERRDENANATSVEFTEIRFELPSTDLTDVVVVDETFGSISVVERRLPTDIADGTEVGVENRSSIDVADPQGDQSAVDRAENPPTVAAAAAETTAALTSDVVEQRYVASDDDADSSSSAVTSSMPPERPTESAADATSTTIVYDRQFSTESGLSISDRSTASDAVVVGASTADSSRRRSSSDAGYLTTWDSASELTTIVPTTAESYVPTAESSDIPTVESSETWWPCGSAEFVDESAVPPPSERRRPDGFDDRSRRR